MENWGFQIQSSCGGELWSVCAGTGEWEGGGLWNYAAPLNSSGVERSPPTQAGGIRPEGSQAIVGQTACGSGSRLAT